MPEGIFAPLRLKGKDALDLIHRLSTNDLTKCRPGMSVPTVFTNEKGRIIDRVEVLAVEDGAWVICHRAAAGSVRNWIEKYTIAEDVEITDVTLLFDVTSVVLNDADSTIVEGAGSSGSGDIREWSVRFGPYTVRRYLMRATETSAFTAQLKASGAEILSAPAYRALRVACGIPSFPEELNDAHNPLESGLRSDISFTKGCYIGQEVIARLDAFKKVQRDLVVLSVDMDDALIPDAAVIETPAGVAGEVTSIGGWQESLHGVMVMGHIQRSALAEGVTLRVRATAGSAPARLLGPAGDAGFSGSMPA